MCSTPCFIINCPSSLSRTCPSLLIARIEAGTSLQCICAPGSDSASWFGLQEGSELAELRAELGEPPEGALTAPQLTTAALLGVMQLYQQWLPEAVADANFDAGRLLNKVDNIYINILNLLSISTELQ